MYNDIASIYQQIFPINQVFLVCLQSLLPEPPASLLDVGCGNGQYVDWFSRHGYYAVGIDSSAGMIEKAKQDYQGNFLQLDFSRIDQLNDTFDCVFCIGNSLSYLPHSDTPKFLDDVRQRLKPGGVLVIQLVNWDSYRLQGKMAFPVTFLQEGMTFYRAYEALDEYTVSFRTELRKDEIGMQNWQAMLYPRYAQSFSSELTAAGYKNVRLFGDFNQVLFDPCSSPALVLIASTLA